MTPKAEPNSKMRYAALNKSIGKSSNNFPFSIIDYSVRNQRARDLRIKQN